MSDKISTDDLFGEDAPAAPRHAPEPPKREKPAARTRAPKPAKADAKPRREPVTIDNAVNIRTLDWECVCGNTNTHTLTQCGKCRDPRYTQA